MSGVNSGNYNRAQNALNMKYIKKVQITFKVSKRLNMNDSKVVSMHEVRDAFTNMRLAADRDAAASASSFFD